MAPILNQTDIVITALDIVRSEGPSRLTARTLAAKLFVAPATLYNYVESMDAIKGLVEEHILSSMLEGVTRGGGPEGIQQMVRWAKEHPLEAELLLDPTRIHHPDATKAVHEVFTELATLPDPSVVEDIRAILGMYILSASNESIDAMPEWYRVATEGYQAAFDADAPKATREITDPTPTALELVRADTDAGDAQRNVRLASLEIIAGGDEWSFQGMAAATGLSVGKLHRLGSRRQHLTAYMIDWTNGAVKAAVDSDDNSIDALDLLIRQFAGSGLSQGAMGDLWAAQDAEYLKVLSQTLVDAGLDKQVPADITVSLLLGPLVSRMCRAEDAAGREAAGDFGVVLMRKVLQP